MKILNLVAFLLISVFTFGQSYPKKLLIYYGTPSKINGSTTIPSASDVFYDYDIIVWPPVESAGHYDNSNSSQILTNLKNRPNPPKVFGYLYVGLGLPTETIDTTALKNRLNQIDNFGFDGVLFDLCGTSDGCTSERLRTAVKHAHFLGLKVIANCQIPEEVLHPSLEPIPHESPLNADDYYLYESYLIMLNQYYTQNDFNYWQLTKSPKIELRRLNGSKSPINILSVSTATDLNYDENKFFFQWHGAWIQGHYATGWGENDYSSDLPSNVARNISPFRLRPVILNPGNTLGNMAVSSDNRYFYNTTNTGQIWINTFTKKFGFVPQGTIRNVDTANWFTPNNWDLYRLPISTDKVFIKANTKINQLISDPAINIKRIETESGAVLDLKGVVKIGD